MQLLERMGKNLWMQWTSPHATLHRFIQTRFVFEWLESRRLLASADWLNGGCLSQDVPDALAPNILPTNAIATLQGTYGPQRASLFPSEASEIGSVGVEQTVPVSFKTPQITPSIITYGPLRAPVRPQLEHYDDDGTLHRDGDGFAYYVDSLEDVDPLENVLDVEQTPPGGDGSLFGGPDLPPIDGDVPAYHSNPQFTKKIYLDFNGHAVSGTTWNNKVYTGNYNTGSVINAPVFSTDSDLTTYNASELATIQEVWARVSEDYAPYQVDVTTEDPGVAAFTAGGQAIRALISTDVDATTGKQWYANAGGVAYLNSWNWTDKSPVWVFYNNLGSGFPKYVAEAVSHEVGHSFGLGHDGRISPSEGYYAGHGSGATGWAPIMGVGYYKSLVQWSKGEYTSANNTQDDLAIINTNLAYIVDDYGNIAASATQITVGTTGAVAISGLITTRTDVDAFRFPTQAGSLTLSVNPFDFSSGKANLDVQLTLLNAAGTILSTINGADVLNASLTTTLPKGFYTLLVDGVGRNAIAGDGGYSDYSSLGKFTVTGSVVPNQAPVALPDSVNIGINQTKLIDVMLNDSDPNLDSFSLLSVGTAGFGTVAIESGKIRYTPPVGYTGTVAFSYTIIDELGATGTTVVTINVVPNSPPVLTSDEGSVVGNEGTTITNTGTWSDPDIPANNVSLFASIGTVSKNTNGTWNWQITPGDQVPSTTVTIGADDEMGGVSSTSFTYEANNLPPILTRSLESVSGNVLSTLVNTGTWSDVGGDNVVISASTGVVVKNANGTWDWTYVPSSAVNSQTVTITAIDKDNGSSFVTFSLTALVAVSNRQLYYKGSDFESAGGLPAALDSAKVLLRSGATTQTTSFANVSSYVRGINGVVLDVAGLASTTLTASDFTFRVAPADISGLVTPNTWETAPAPTSINVTPGDATTPARIRLVWADNAIQNTWLQIIVNANANTGLANREVYYLGHALGEVNGATPYRITSADQSAVQTAVSISVVSVNEVRDVNKDRRITSADLSFVQVRVSSTTLLRDIKIPTSGSTEEGEGSPISMGVLPTSNPATPKHILSEASVLIPTIRPRWTGLDYAVPRPVDVRQPISDELVYGPMQEKSKTGDAERDIGAIDYVFSGFRNKWSNS